jgi:hypothetical protein
MFAWQSKDLKEAETRMGNSMEGSEGVEFRMSLCTVGFCPTKFKVIYSLQR